MTMKPVYERNPLLGNTNKFCPGCGHSLVNKIIADVLVENDWTSKAIEALCIGCALQATHYCNWDLVQSPHGRAAAVATGVKHIQKDALVFTYQGDGDAAGIGLTETFHAASRGEPITQIMVNNQIYGMTGGQLGPTTLLGQVTTTSPTGRNVPYYGYPIKIAEHIAMCDGTAYSARVSLDSVPNIRKAKQAIRKAFEVQEKGLGFGFVEILSSCPTNWRMTPEKAHDRVKNEMMEVFKPGVYKDITENNN